MEITPVAFRYCFCGIGRAPMPFSFNSLRGERQATAKNNFVIPRRFAAEGYPVPHFGTGVFDQS